MKAIWTGTISFGLVEIPIKIVSAIQEHTLGFHLLHAKCHTRLEYQRWCPHCKEDVSWDNTVKGYEQTKGTYRIFTKEELEQYKPEKTDRIDMLAFVSHDSIADIYQEHHYYVLPEKQSNKSYFLFYNALQKSGLVGVGHFVMRDKEYLCSIEAHQQCLLLNTLHYAYEIRSLTTTRELSNSPKITKDEIALATTLIAQMTKKKFDITQYKDTYAEQLMKALKSKKKPTKIIKKKERTAKKDLVSLLRSSLQKTEQTRPAAYASTARKRKKIT